MGIVCSIVEQYRSKIKRLSWAYIIVWTDLVCILAPFMAIILGPNSFLIGSNGIKKTSRWAFLKSRQR